MEMKTICKLGAAGAIVVASILFGCGIIGGGEVKYQLPGPYVAESTNNFSTVRVEATVQGDKITDCVITSSGESDLMNDATRQEWAEAIVEAQSADTDVITGASLTYSAASVKEAVDDILVQAGIRDASEIVPLETEPETEGAEAKDMTEPETEAEPEAEAVTGAGGYVDGTYHVQKATDFSTIDVEIAVENGAIVNANVTSAALEGQVDMLTDDIRAAWADQIVKKQDVDAVTGVTVSSDAAREAVEELLAQAAGETAGPEAEGMKDGDYTVQKTTAFSTIDVGMTVENGAVASANVTSAALEGQVDMLTDDIRAAWADQIVEKQAVDAVTGVTVSSDAAKEAVEELLAQAAGGDSAADDGRIAELEAALADAEARAKTAEAKAAEMEAVAVAAEAKVAELEAAESAPAEATPVEELPAAQAPGLQDGTYTVEKTTAFSTIDVEMTVENGAVAAASVTSAALEGQVDMLNDDIRTAWGDQIIKKQAVDAVTGVTVSSDAAQEAVEELLAQAGGGQTAAGVVEAEAETEPAEPEAAVDTEPVEAETATTEAEAVTAKAEAATAEAETVTAEADARPVQASAEPAEDEAVTVEAGVEPAQAGALPEAALRLMRARPDTQSATDAVAPVEEEAEQAQALPEAALRLMRARPDTQSESDAAAPVEEETEQAQALPEAALRLMRQRPGTQAAAEAEAPVEVATESAAQETEPDEGDRMAAILPYIVTSMGDNSRNSYVTSYLEEDPYLVNIYEGYGFAKDYGSARGHTYTLEDVSNTQRPHPKANCITCKTPDLHKLVEQEGVAVYSMPFDEVMAQMTQSVSCYTCHGSDTGNNGALQVTHQYVNEALGDNVSTINPATLSCGQCHIEYYFTPSDSETMMPYHSVGEMTPEAILAYYDAMDFADWTQESTGTRMLKAQHPEMETVLQGKHAAFLSCADCHMPTETTEDGIAYSSHMLVSPLDSPALLESCARCHGDTDMTAFVHEVQARVTARETEIGNKLSDMKDALASAVASGEWDEAELEAVRKLHREAQWFFDFCYVENSEGAHNSELAMTCLDTSEAKIDEAMALLGTKQM